MIPNGLKTKEHHKRSSKNLRKTKKFIDSTTEKTRSSQRPKIIPTQPRDGAQYVSPVA
jgi:hypothetical protein